MGSVSVMVFTRDLRVRDNPALVAAVAASDAVVPLFVVDDSLPISTSANRRAFLVDSLRDLDRSLRAVGGQLVLRHGRWIDEVLAVAAGTGATSIHLADDVSGFAQRRLEHLRLAAGERIQVVTHPGVTVVPPGDLTPGASGDHYKVFNPYFQRWKSARWRRVCDAPTSITLPASGLGRAGLGALDDLPTTGRSPDLIAGGETAALARLKAWAASGLAGYGDRHDDLAGDATSRVSAALHFGCVSPAEVATRLRGREGGAALVRQLCWRDFYHQVLAARPDTSQADYRSRGDRWHDDDDGFQAWCDGRTGYPLVDAAMRQLATEGFMHNRARMVVASFLTKDLYIDWRRGADHFMSLLVDGDVANNQLNWQWTAGTGTDTNAYRVFNPVRQSERFDPDGDYIRRYLPELTGLRGAAVHRPDEQQRRSCGYVAPIVDHADAVAHYRARTRI